MIVIRSLFARRLASTVGALGVAILVLSGCSLLDSNPEFEKYTNEVRAIPGVRVATGTTTMGHHASTITTLHVEMDAQPGVYPEVMARVCSPIGFKAGRQEFVLIAAHTRLSWETDRCEDPANDVMGLIRDAEATEIDSSLSVVRTKKSGTHVNEPVRVNISRPADFSHVLALADAIAPHLENTPTVVQGNGIDIHSDNRGQLTTALRTAHSVASEYPMNWIQLTDALSVDVPEVSSQDAVAAAFAATAPEFSRTYEVMTSVGAILRPAQGTYPETAELVSFLSAGGYTTRQISHHRFEIDVQNIDELEALSREVATRNAGRAAVRFSIPATSESIAGFMTLPEVSSRVLTPLNNPYPGYADLYRKIVANGGIKSITFAPDSLGVQTVTDADHNQNIARFLSRLAQDQDLPELILNGRVLARAPK
ncbi:hypothetical protein [Mycetocola saprophilus]|uniref:hypothetical protein n=1 Tax=Mycetocola saprophilus TaxID=76636 RepID=UPI003BF41093